MAANIFDTHAHYHDRQFDEDRETLLAELPSAGIFRVVNCGTDAPTSQLCCDYADRYDYIYAACGVHPHDCHHESEDWPERIASFAPTPSAWRWGISAWTTTTISPPGRCSGHSSSGS